MKRERNTNGPDRSRTLNTLNHTNTQADTHFILTEKRNSTRSDTLRKRKDAKKVRVINYSKKGKLLHRENCTYSSKTVQDRVHDTVRH